MQTQKITLDFCQNDYKTVTVKQYDKDSRNLIITCTDNGSFYKLDSSTLQCNVKMITPDDRAIYDTATINENGTVLVTFSESMVYASGTGKLEIQFLDLSTKKSISTMILTVIIVGSVYSDDKIIASDEFNALIDTLVEVENSVNATNEAIERMNAFEESISVAEAVRATNEESRVLAETNRVVEEESRISNEESRISAENNRANKENMRINAENIRVANEEFRILAENNRVNEENARIDAENIRIANETLRQSQEDIRQSNDVLREAAVSTAVAKSEEAITIAKGKNRASVFPTVSSMQEALADESNKGLYQVGDNLYIVDIKVPDYWIQEVLDEPDSDTGLYYKISELETQKVDLSDINLDALVESVAYISDESDVEASIGTVLTTQNIIDNVDSSSSKMVLSANQGKILNDKISIINEDVVELQNAKDITTTTSTTMPNSCEGRLLFKEIRGKTEKLTSTGKNLMPVNDITFTGTNRITFENPIPAGTYTMSAEAVSSDTYSPKCRAVFYSDSVEIGNVYLTRGIRCGGTITVESEITSVVLCASENYTDSQGDTATWSNIQIEAGSTMTAYEPYDGGTPKPFIRSVDISGIKTYSKNLVEITLTSQTVNGVQLTVNDDKTIIADGTATTDTYFTIGVASLVIDTEYIVSGCPNGGNPLSYGWYYDSSSINGTPWDYGKENEPFTALATETKRCAIYFKQGVTLSNIVFKPMIRKADIEDDTYEPYCGSSITFSSPIELNKIGDVQDVIVDGKPIRRITKKRITSDMAILSNSEWPNKQAFVIESFFSDGLQVYDAEFLKIANILCTHATTSSAGNIAAGSVMNGVAQNMYTNLFFSFDNCPTIDAVKTFLDANVVYVYYELATPTDLPIADQVALNSLKTCDGTTYLEFDSPLQPEFVAEYGTSKVGGVALEAKGESQANSVNIEELDAILQDAFIPRDTSQFVSDANLCLKSGIYRTGSDSTNIKYTNGFLLVFAIDTNMVVQINMLWDPWYIYIRTYWWGTWHGWYKIATELDISALEAAMVNNI